MRAREQLKRQLRRMTDSQWASEAMAQSVLNPESARGVVCGFRELEEGRCATVMSNPRLLRDYFKSRSVVRGYLASDGTHKRIQSGSTILWLCAQHRDGRLYPLTWFVVTGDPQCMKFGEGQATINPHTNI